MKTAEEARAAIRNAKIDQSRHMFYGERTLTQLAIARQAVKDDPEYKYDITAITVCGCIANAYKMNGR